MNKRIWNNIIWILKREKELGNDKINFTHLKEKLFKYSKLDMSKKEKDMTFDELINEILHCTKCKLHKFRTNPVVGEGPENAKLMFIGEAPGADEDRTGRPFVGRAGRKLREILKKVGITEKDFYISNIIKCRPPQNRDPEEDEIKACSPYIRLQIKKIKPKIICTLGRYAAYFILDEVRTMGSLRGQIFEKENYIVIPVYHPSFILRNNRMEPIFEKDLRLVKQKLDELK